MKVLRPNSVESLESRAASYRTPLGHRDNSSCSAEPGRGPLPQPQSRNSPGEGCHFFQLLLSSAPPLEQPGSAKQQQLSIQLSVSIE